MNLKKAGFGFKLEDLDHFEYQYLTLIASELNRLEHEEIERGRKKRGK